MLSTAEPAAPAAEPATRFDALFERLYPGLFGLTYRVLGDWLETETPYKKPSSAWPMHPYCNAPTTRWLPGGPASAEPERQSPPRRLPRPAAPGTGRPPGASRWRRGRRRPRPARPSVTKRRPPCARRSPSYPSGSATAWCCAIPATPMPRSRPRSASPSARSASCSPVPSAPSAPPTRRTIMTTCPTRPLARLARRRASHSRKRDWHVHRGARPGRPPGRLPGLLDDRGRSAGECRCRRWRHRDTRGSRRLTRDRRPRPSAPRLGTGRRGPRRANRGIPTPPTREPPAQRTRHAGRVRRTSFLPESVPQRSLEPWQRRRCPSSPSPMERGAGGARPVPLPNLAAPLAGGRGRLPPRPRHPAVGTPAGRTATAQFLAQFRSQRFAVVTIEPGSATAVTWPISTTWVAYRAAPARAPAPRRALRGRSQPPRRLPRAAAGPARAARRPERPRRRCRSRPASEFRLTFDRSKARAYFQARTVTPRSACRALPGRHARRRHARLPPSCEYTALGPGPGD